jgi:hypothetical protein
MARRVMQRFSAKDAIKDEGSESVDSEVQLKEEEKE